MLKWLFTCKLKDKEAICRAFWIIGQVLLGGLVMAIGAAALLTWVITIATYLNDEMWAGDFTLWIIWVPVVIAVFLLLKTIFCEEK